MFFCMVIYLFLVIIFGNLSPNAHIRATVPDANIYYEMKEIFDMQINIDHYIHLVHIK